MTRGVIARALVWLPEVFTLRVRSLHLNPNNRATSRSSVILRLGLVE